MAEFVIDLTKEEQYNVAHYYDRQCEVSINNIFRKIRDGRWLEERKRGEWNITNILDNFAVECSNCGYQYGNTSFKFCPICGVKMKVRE